MYNYKSEAQKTMMRDVQAGHDIDGIILNAMFVARDTKALESFQLLNGISDREYLILAVLSKKRECSLAELVKFAGIRKGLATSMQSLLRKKMAEQKMVLTLTNKTENHFWITGLGEQVLIKARNHFITHL